MPAGGDHCARGDCERGEGEAAAATRRAAGDRSAMKLGVTRRRWRDLVVVEVGDRRGEDPLVGCQLVSGVGLADVLRGRRLGVGDRLVGGCVQGVVGVEVGQQAAERVIPVLCHHRVGRDREPAPA
jgi:hypothetical protein